LIDMSFCVTGNHDTDQGFKYDGAIWCPEHLPPSGPPDPVPAGICDVSRKAHNAPRGVWYLPVTGNSACSHHLGVIVREAVRRGEFGR
jgi:hypothetical protein